MPGRHPLPRRRLQRLQFRSSCTEPRCSMLASLPRGPHNLDRRRPRRGLHGANPRHRPTLRPLLSAQIRSRRLENQQVSGTRHARTLDREPTRVRSRRRATRAAGRRQRSASALGGPAASGGIPPPAFVFLADDLLAVSCHSGHASVRMRAEIAGLIAVAGRSDRMAASRGRSSRWRSGHTVVAMVALGMVMHQGCTGYRSRDPCCWASS